MTKGKKKSIRSTKTPSSLDVADLLESMLKLPDILIISLDLRGRLLRFNAGCEKLTGYDEKEVLGKSLFSLLIPKKERAGARQIFKDLLTSKEPLWFTSDWSLKTGEPRTVTLNFTVITKDNDVVKEVFGVGFDISEQQRVRASYEESEARYRLLLENIPDGFIITDTKGKVTASNLRAAELFGYNVGEIPGSRVNRFFHPRNQFRLRKMLNDSLKSLEIAIESSDWTGRRKDGSFFPMHLTCSFIQKDYKPQGFQFIIRDVTDQREIESALEQQEKALELLNGIAALTVLADRRIEDFLKSVVVLLPSAWQYPVMTCARIIWGDTIVQTPNFQETKWKQSTEFMVHGKRAGVVEVCYLREMPEADEGPFLREERELLNIIAIPLGETIEHILAQREIQETMARLQESEEFSYNILNYSPTPIIVINPDTSIRYVNLALQELTGFPAGELIGMKAPYPWWLEENKAALTKELMQTIEDSQIHLETQYQTKDGGRLWVELISQPIHSEKGFEYRLTSWINITERKQIENTLLDAEARLRAIYRIVEIGILQIDSQGNILESNPAARRILGYTENEMGYTNYKDLIYSDDVTSSEDLIKRIKEGKRDYGEIEHRFIRKNGMVFRAMTRIMMARLTEDQSPTFTIMINDITQKG